MDHKRNGMAPPIGVSSLIVIFAVLCLTVFALLSICTVQADQRLREKTEQTVTGYYAADCAAEEILARLRTGERPENVTEENGVFSYRCAISDTQELAVEVELHGSDYRILRWQTVSTAQWITVDDLPVWDGF